MEVGKKREREKESGERERCRQKRERLDGVPKTVLFRKAKKSERRTGQAW